MDHMVQGQEQPLFHFVVVPLMSQGHMIPMADLALLLARRGARVSLITTPVNARRLRATADQAIASNLLLRLVELPFNCKAAGLPDGCENLDLITRVDLVRPFFKNLDFMADPLKKYLRAQPPSPTCIIADQCMPWTMEVSDDLGIPRLVFYGPSCFFVLCTLKLAEHKLYEKVTDVQEIFTVPELPNHRIEVNKLAAQRFFDRPDMVDVMQQVEEAEGAADGVVLNTFDELESCYIDEYRRSIGKDVWAVGPVSLFHEGVDGKAVRGDGSTGVDHDRVLQWLDGKETGSVLYINFGSISRTRLQQLVEIGFGLEASGQSFVWAVKEESEEETKKWHMEFEERNRERGIVIKGWLPQVLILTHPAVGGFMTHCGWNSTLEAVAAGVPMVTWPHFFDQFLNEKLVVEVLRIGVGVGVKWPFYRPEALVRREAVEEAVRSVMLRGEEIRKTAGELAKKAKKAMEEGGSSYENLSNLIYHVKRRLEGSLVHGTTL